MAPILNLGLATPGDLRLESQAAAEHSLGDEAASDRDLKSLETHSANVSAFQVAEVYAWRGDRDRAFAWLKRAYRQRDGGFELFKSDIYLEGLYTDPRYKALRGMQVASYTVASGGQALASVAQQQPSKGKIP